MFFFTSERCNQENDFMRKLDALSAENTIKKKKKVESYVFSNRVGEKFRRRFLMTALTTFGRFAYFIIT